MVTQRPPFFGFPIIIASGVYSKSRYPEEKQDILAGGIPAFSELLVSFSRRWYIEIRKNKGGPNL